MKAIVFGGAGFLGSHVADVLTERGHNVVIFDLKKSLYLKEKQFSIAGDINDQRLVEKAIKGCEVVYNFAGISDMEKARKRPLEAVRNNILGNTILLEASKNSAVKRFVFASTLYVYSKAGSFYRSTKQACELLLENYKEIYGLNYTILRYGSLYGPRANDHNWIKKILTQAVTKGKIVRYGDGDELREYIHVFDAARLSVDILKDEYRNQHVIIAGNQPTKVKDLLVMIKEMLDNKIQVKFLPARDQEHYEITPYSFAPKLAKRVQGNHYVDLGEGILDLVGQIYKRKHEKAESHNF